ncbi:hypothetical protein ACH5RR_035415 [Cinchona calisaya]|uniref:NAB domain-containing protein n=1 Tax=Cinchona calisaya TaxID=153742 RepID=A0ABD2Y2J4_9GENT
MENNGSDQATSDPWCPHQSQRLQSTLAELDRKIKMILELVEDNGDTFAQRAEMYYKKRPELIKVVVDLQRSYISLANKYDLLRSESLCGSSSNSFRLQLVPSSALLKLDHDEGAEERVNSCNNGNVGDYDSKRDSTSRSNDRLFSSEREKMWNKMWLSVSQLIEDNTSQQAELIRRNNEKRESIKELGLYVNKLQKENRRLKHSLSHLQLNNNDNYTNIDHLKQNRSHMSKLKGLVFGK